MTEIKRYISYGGMIDCETKERTDIDSVFVRYSDIEKVLEENAKLREVMVAAAEELAAHWQAHCDSDGYGPANLEHRLKNCLVTSYPGYSIGEFDRLQKELKATREELAGAYERCAKICDDLEDKRANYSWEPNPGDCATAIRALKGE